MEFGFAQVPSELHLSKGVETKGFKCLLRKYLEIWHFSLPFSPSYIHLEAGILPRNCLLRKYLGGVCFPECRFQRVSVTLQVNSPLFIRFKALDSSDFSRVGGVKPYG